MGGNTEGWFKFWSKIMRRKSGILDMDHIIWYLPQRPTYYDGPIFPQLGYHMAHIIWVFLKFLILVSIRYYVRIIFAIFDFLSNFNPDKSKINNSCLL